MVLAQNDKVVDVMKAAMDEEKAMKEKETNNMNEQKDENLRNHENDSTDTEVSNSTEESKQEDVSSEETLMDGEDLETDADETDSSVEKQGKKSFFKSAKSKEMAMKDQKIEELTDRLKRNMAEFDNYRKRTEKEKTQMFELGAKSIIEKILPVIDNFERGLAAVSEEEKGGAFAQGIELIYKQLMTTLTEIGVEPIDAVGKEFDPALHNAVMHGEDDSLGENIVSDEFQKGYLYKGNVVRYSMVKVVN